MNNIYFDPEKEPIIIRVRSHMIKFIINQYRESEYQIMDHKVSKRRKNKQTIGRYKSNEEADRIEDVIRS